MIGLIANPQVALDSCVDHLDLEKLFGRVAPLHVDLGCGDGLFLCDLAQKCPEINFLGIERLTGRVEKACRRACPSQTGGKIDNVRVLQMETSYAVRNLLPPASVETFYLLFPDPWPKRRHHRRRVVTPEFLDSIHLALEENGLLHIATDHVDYFREIVRLAESAVGLVPWHRHPADENMGWKPMPHFDLELPLSKFEKRFRAQGAPIYRLSLRKISPVT